MIMSRRAIDNSNYIVKQKLGEKQLTISELKEKIQNGDNSIGRKILYFWCFFTRHISVLDPKGKRVEIFDSISN